MAFRCWWSTLCGSTSKPLRSLSIFEVRSDKLEVLVSFQCQRAAKESFKVHLTGMSDDGWPQPGGWGLDWSPLMAALVTKGICHRRIVSNVTLQNGVSLSIVWYVMIALDTGPKSGLITAERLGGYPAHPWLLKHPKGNVRTSTNVRPWSRISQDLGHGC